MFNRNKINILLDKMPEIFSSMLVMIVILGISVFAGVISSLGEVKLVIGFLSIFVLLFFLINYKALIWFIFLGGLMFTGLISLYFPQYSQVRWLFSLSGLLLYPVIFFHITYKKSEKVGVEITLAYVFIAFALLSLFINYNSKIGMIIGVKNYLQVWSLMFAFYYLNLQVNDIKKFIKAVLIIGVIQIPFALHQFFILVPRRIVEFSSHKGLVAYDIVVGTFVGNVEGGGGNSILSFFLIFCLSLVLALYRKKLMLLPTVLILSILFLFPIMLNETKTSFIFIPIALTLVFWDKIKSSPLHVIAGGLILVMFFSSLLFIYSILPRSQKERTVAEYIERSLAYNIGDAGYSSFVLNRKGVLVFWLQERKNYPVYNALIGHGLGSSNDPKRGFYINTLANRKYFNYGIGLTAISSLLWDVGIIGVILITLIFYSFFRLAWKLSKNNKLPENFQAIYQAVSVGILLSFLSLFFYNYFVFEIGFQTIVMFLFGIALFGKQKVEKKPVPV